MPAPERQCIRTCMGSGVLRFIICRETWRREHAWLQTACMCETSSFIHLVLFYDAYFILLFTVLKILNHFLFFVWNLIAIGIGTKLDCMGIYWCTVTTTFGGNVPPSMVVIDRHAWWWIIYTKIGGLFGTMKIHQYWWNISTTIFTV